LDCKKILIDNLNHFLDPIREKRKKYEAIDTQDILENGIKNARKAAKQTLEEVRELVKV
ncbi:MAG: tryptophan--tRNA ligase, partial [Candidatus Aminicenantes bacterium]|nr:tryptophan--tRNA ligase [Candidatus Aminicenantes bacterium]NIM82241.1 tryptophan--tRNA ligase [Candidatus Aminicenantes bacterium]NIN20654.1 tryptophan--tRNA ligase [Candidatus Aminicenantes bacterium]NIN44433.1 tryptophan--tRNA ligase [Candidatus Aminicenantes bacterium]NIN87252.1 tryptophan--tRNA ligase [Candidatus Aminicenantes bacterium]